MSTNPFLSPHPTGLSTNSSRYAPPPGPPPPPTATRPITSTNNNVNEVSDRTHGADPLQSPQRTGGSYAPPPGPPPRHPTLAGTTPSSTFARPSSRSPPTQPAQPAAAVTPNLSVTTPEPSNPPAIINNTTTSAADTAMNDDPDGPSEPPPPYSLAPNAWQGEETVQYGPRHPFQPAPAPLRPVPSQSTRPQQQQQQTGGYSPSPSTPSSGAGFNRPPGAPPRHPSTLLSPTGPSGGSRRAASFSGPHNNNNNNPDPSMSTPGGYAPPQQQPQQDPSLSRRRSDDGSRRQARTNEGQSIPDDGKPTRKPVPGHPYMHQGQVLVYPPRFTCHKCSFNFLTYA